MSDVILSGMRPTGALHLGHYVGVITNWVELQKDHDCFFFVADWHAITTLHTKLDVLNKSRLEYVRGWLASGVDPEKSHIYNQSWIPEILYLEKFFLSMTPPGWADRSPSWKDLKVNPDRQKDNLGFYTYPILQTADIAAVKGTLVPVGEDQDSHIEISREIVRKFNRLYKTNLPEPQAKHTKVPKLLGLDGSKMSSSVGNVISLQETEKSMQKKINKMKTDDTRAGIEAPGNPDNCTVFDYHKIFSPAELTEEVRTACQEAQLGCGECKQKLGGCMKEKFMPIAQRMENISDRDCEEVLRSGTDRVRKIIQDHWKELNDRIGFH